MRDGYTRRIDRVELEEDAFEEFMKKWEASITIVAGGPEGSEYLLEKPTTSMGRGADVDLTFDDQTMSREHAVVEFSGVGFRVRDLGSMNGIIVNETEAKVGDLKSGDRFQVGQHVFQFVLSKRQSGPKTYVIDEE